MNTELLIDQAYKIKDDSKNGFVGIGILKEINPEEYPENSYRFELINDPDGIKEGVFQFEQIGGAAFPFLKEIPGILFDATAVYSELTAAERLYTSMENVCAVLAAVNKLAQNNKSQNTTDVNPEVWVFSSLPEWSNDGSVVFVMKTKNQNYLPDWEITDDVKHLLPASAFEISEATFQVQNMSETALRAHFEALGIKEFKLQYE